MIPNTLSKEQVSAAKLMAMVKRLATDLPLEKFDELVRQTEEVFENVEGLVAGRKLHTYEQRDSSKRREYLQGQIKLLEESNSISDDENPPHRDFFIDSKPGQSWSLYPTCVNPVKKFSTSGCYTCWYCETCKAEGKSHTGCDNQFIHVNASPRTVKSGGKDD